ncbi:hypothetical protein N0V91_005402 [Didymella pomorum]|uniref:Uncharacterized protein n=1 Tax=Didymella pomorum TaxID=749634 RepID=A0A9W8ZFA6_9PLEO|nr:hypothetical protein N0V91_005402 [Didymella pomorum]
MSSVRTGTWGFKIGIQKESKVKIHNWKAPDPLKGIVNLPLEANRRHLTLAFEHARAHNRTDLMLKDLPVYIK